MDKFIKLKHLLLQKIEDLRLKIATNPKVIIWRLRIFGFSPFINKHFFKIINLTLLTILLFTVFYTFSWRSPRPFPEQALITIERGDSLSKISKSFEEGGVVRSSFWLKTFIFILGGQRRVIAGDYYLPSAVNVFQVAGMIHNGEFGLIAKKITIPEGISSFDMAEIFEKELPAFQSKEFLDEVADNNYEGYLFPDTYFFTPNTKAKDIILMMRENFTRQIQPYNDDILKSEKPLNDLVIMASIIEEEANNSIETKRIVAGILWKRIRLNMPLQVDAPFVYYNGKNSYTLTKEDLAEDHPYNTYINKGLLPTAIASPGIDSLRAAIAPTQSSYLYFLSDRAGNMYYAKDFEGHKRNRELYLD